MSEQNVAAVRGLYEAFARGDVPAVLDGFTDDIDWYTPDSLPFGGSFQGRDAVAGFFQSLPKYYEELRVEPDEYVATGDRVVAIGHHRGRTTSGNSFEIPFAMVWTVTDGKASTFREHTDTAAFSAVL
jgi:uncharacterized protein